MMLEIPIIHAMKYDDKPKCAYRWSMTHIGFDTLQMCIYIFQTYEQFQWNCVCLCDQSAPVFTYSFLFRSIPLVRLSVGYINLFMSLTTLQPKCIMFLSVLLYSNATNSYQHVNRKQKHGLFHAYTQTHTDAFSTEKNTHTDRFSSTPLTLWEWTSEQVIEQQKYRKQENSLSFGLVSVLAKMVKINSAYISKRTFGEFECEREHRNVDDVGFYVKFSHNCSSLYIYIYIVWFKDITQSQRINVIQVWVSKCEYVSVSRCLSFSCVALFHWHKTI